jgi:hypothetical protein
LSALTFYNTLVTLLNNNGYKEIPEVIEIDEIKLPHKNFCFILRPVGSEEDEQGQCLLTAHEWQLELIYFGKTSADKFP